MKPAEFSRSMAALMSTEAGVEIRRDHKLHDEILAANNLEDLSDRSKVRVIAMLEVYGGR